MGLTAIAGNSCLVRYTLNPLQNSRPRMAKRYVGEVYMGRAGAESPNAEVIPGGRAEFLRVGT